MGDRIWAVVCRNTAMQWGGIALGAAFQMGILWFLTRTLSMSQFGIFSCLVTLFYIGTAFVDFGGNTIAAREMARRMDQAPLILGEVITWKIVLALAYGTGVVMLVSSQWEGAGWMALAFLLAAILALPFNTLSVVLQVRQRFPALTLLRVMGGVLNLLVVALLYAGGSLSVGGATAAFSGGILLNSLLLWILAGKEGRFAFFQGKLGLFKRILPQGIASLAGVLYFYQDTLMLKYLVGDGEAGLYSAGYRLFGFFASLPGLAMLSLFPILSAAAAGERGSFASLYRQAFFRFMSIALPLALVMPSLAGALVGFLYPPAYKDATSVLIFLTFGGVFLFCGALCSYGLIALGGERTWMVFCLAGVFFNFLLNLCLIQVLGLGARGAAIGTVLTEGLMAVLAFAAVAKRGGGSPLERSFWLVGVFALFMGGAGLLLKSAPLIPLVCVLGILGGGGLWWLWRGRGAAEPC